jgi:antitoxin PrlF
MAQLQKQARITSKGQITVPRDVRRALGVQAGDRLLFEQDDGHIRVRAVRSRSPFEKYEGIGNPGMPSGRKALQKWFREFRGRSEGDSPLIFADRRG